MEWNTEYRNMIIQYAKQYIDLGITVVPFRPRSKDLYLEYANGITIDELARLVEKEEVNIGAKCTDGLVVLDFEDIELITEFLPSWSELRRETICVKTPNGIHVYLRTNSNIKSKSYKALSLNLISGDDYAILPPSIHPTGEQYTFFSGGILDIKKFDGDIDEFIEGQMVKFKLRIKKRAEQVTEAEVKDIEEGKIKEKDRWWARVVLYLKLREQRKNRTEIEEKIYEANNNLAQRESMDVIEKHLDWLFSTFPLISPDLIYDDRGKPLPGFVAELYLSEKLWMVFTVKNKDQNVFFFNGKVWEEAEPDIAAFTENLLREKATTHFVNEVINHVKRLTFDSQKQLQREPPLHLIPLLNGVYDLEKNKLIDYEPEHCFVESQILPVFYDPEAKATAIEKFFSEVLHPGDIPVIKEYIGFCLYRRYFLNKSLVLVGSGSNGKSVFLRMLKEFLGQKNVSARTLQELISNRFAPASLYRKLANIFADLPNNALKSTSMFKALTGEDLITTEKKFGKDPLEFINYAKLIFSMNALPEAYDDTDAFYRRFLIIEFPNTFEGQKADPFLLQKLTTKEEMSGLLNIAIKSLRDLLERGNFSNNQTIEIVKKEYKKKANAVACFADEMIEEDPDSVVIVQDVYEKFLEFCKQNNLVPCSDKVFGKKLKLAVEFDFNKVRKEIDGRLRSCYSGIRIKGSDSKKNIDTSMSYFQVESNPSET